MARGRLGHQAIPLRHNRLLLAGGLRPGPSADSPFIFEGVTEIWTGAPAPAGCAETSGN